MHLQLIEVAIGIDAAVVANHRVVVRRPTAGRPGEILDDFEAGPTLSGLERLSKRLAAYPGAVAVAEPTSMTWLPLAAALEEAGVSLALMGNRHAGRLRAALAGKDKSDVIDAEMLSRAGEFFSLQPLPDPRSPGTGPAESRPTPPQGGGGGEPALPAPPVAGTVGLPGPVAGLREVPRP